MVRGLTVRHRIEREQFMALPRQEPALRTLTQNQLAGIRIVMQTFVTDDLSRGVSPVTRMYCDGCRGQRPKPGFLAYEEYQLCNVCATNYEVARAYGQVATPGQFVGDQRFGEEFHPQLKHSMEA
jgi:hypothetical protein